MFRPVGRSRARGRHEPQRERRRVRFERSGRSDHAPRLSLHRKLPLLAPRTRRRRATLQDKSFHAHPLLQMRSRDHAERIRAVSAPRQGSTPPHRRRALRRRRFIARWLRGLCRVQVLATRRLDLDGAKGDVNEGHGSTAAAAGENVDLKCPLEQCGPCQPLFAALLPLAGPMALWSWWCGLASKYCECGRFRLELPVGFNRNQWSDWIGMGGRFQSESVVGFGWITQCLPTRTRGGPNSAVLRKNRVIFHETPSTSATLLSN